eukprot:m.239431 g.239431  ORF g.239431 m.239431 type:complete len:114 (+) comp17120_c1_seq1:1345-1686(+)
MGAFTELMAFAPNTARIIKQARNPKTASMTVTSSSLLLVDDEGAAVSTGRVGVTEVVLCAVDDDDDDGGRRQSPHICVQHSQTIEEVQTAIAKEHKIETGAVDAFPFLSIVIS